MTFIKKVGAVIVMLILSITTSSALSKKEFSIDHNIISEYQIKQAATIDEGVKLILESVKAYGLNEYQEQVDEGEEEPFFWLAKPLNTSANNVVDMFAPDFTQSIHMGACFEKYFNIYMQEGDSVADAQAKAKQAIPNCLANHDSPLEGMFASQVRQMVLCQPKHGQILLDSKDSLFFSAAMPCHLSIYKVDGKIYVSWRNVEKMAQMARLNRDKQKLAKEVQDDMEAMLGDL